MDRTKGLAIGAGILVLIIALGIVIYPTPKKFGGGVTAAEVNNLIATETAYFQANGKYKGVLKGEISPYIEVTEYQAPGGFGYQAKQWEDRADGLWMRSFGTGPESNDRTFGWKLVESNVPYDPLATSTQ